MTDFEEPLDKALEILQTSAFKKADITFITDGECDVSDEFLKKFRQVKEDKEFNVVSVLVDAGGGRVSDSTLNEFSDKIVKVSSIADLSNSDTNTNSEILSSVSSN